MSVVNCRLPVAVCCVSNPMCAAATCRPSPPAAAGASYEVTDPDKGNPAQIAAYWGHLEAVVKLVEAGCSWPHGKTARGVAGGDVVKWICNITTNKVCRGGIMAALLPSAACA